MMTIIYFGTTGCADSDFPLIRALQKQGIDVYSYFYVEKSNCKSGLFNVDLKHKNGIIPATEYERFFLKICFNNFIKPEHKIQKF